MNKILLALDLHEPPSMTRAVETMAQSLGASLDAVHVIQPPDVVPFTGYEGLIGLEGLPYTAYDPAVARERDEAETDAFERFLLSHFQHPIRHAIRRGDPAIVILEEARALDADLVVMGKRRHGLVERLFVGSVASAVLKDCKRPVLLYPLTDDGG